MLLALLDNHADEFDNAVEELGKWVDHLRQAGHPGDDRALDACLPRPLGA